MKKKNFGSAFVLKVLRDRLDRLSENNFLKVNYKVVSKYINFGFVFGYFHLGSDFKKQKLKILFGKIFLESVFLTVRVRLCPSQKCSCPTVSEFPPTSMARVSSG